MTNLEKQRIIVMRSGGKSYNTIAKELNLPVNSVKTFCRRNRLGGVRAIENLSSTSEENCLIDTTNRGNSRSDDKQCERGRGTALSYKVKLTFADENDEAAIPDVLGMLIRSKCRQG